MSQYYRTIVVPKENKSAVVTHGSEMELVKDLVADIVIREDMSEDDDDEALSSLDFTGVRTRMTVKKGFTYTDPFHPVIITILSMLGIKLDGAYTAILAALYEETGFDEYSREECDRLYLNTILQGKGWLLHTVLYGILLMLIGNNYKWRNDKEEVTVATMTPIWNNY